MDGEPITVLATPDGALWLRVRDTKSQPPSDGWALVDTSAPVNLWHDPRDRSPQLDPRNFDVLAPDANAVRGRFEGVWALGTPLTQPQALAAEGGPGAAVAAAVAQAHQGLPVLAVLGGEFWRGFAPILDRTPDASAPTLTLWDQQPASTGFLDMSQYAVLELDLFGGGQLNAKGAPDVFGLRGPHQFPGSQLVVRGCAAPSAFSSETDTLPTCCRGDERRLATGADVALVVTTGLGGVVFSESGWARMSERIGQAPASMAAPATWIYHPAQPRLIEGRVFSLPRLALVNLEVPVGQDPGACVELGRARRTELVSISQRQNSSVAQCAPPCDMDPREPNKALSSAAYVELGGDIPVTVVPDGANLIQALRAEIRPEGPEVDGLLGASALKSLRIELDYRPRPARLIFSCQAGESQTCRSVGRCPRLPNRDSTRVCFNVPVSHRLPETCDNTAQVCP